MPLGTQDAKLKKNGVVLLINILITRNTHSVHVHVVFHHPLTNTVGVWLFFI